jgi:Protein of unknown function (DUF2934)
MPNQTTKRTPTLVRTAPPGYMEEKIRRRAYELYEARGREHGRDLEDWFRAEAEVTGKKVRTVTAN